VLLLIPKHHTLFEMALAFVIDLFVKNGFLFSTTTSSFGDYGDVYLVFTPRLAPDPILMSVGPPGTVPQSLTQLPIMAQNHYTTDSIPSHDFSEYIQ